MGKNRDFSKFPNAITVLDNGNVGIGQTNPTYTLDVTGPARINGSYVGHNFIVQNTNSGYYSSVQYLDNTGTEKFVMGYGNASLSNSIASKAFILTPAGVDMNFYTNGINHRMIINSTGFIGIGTTNPTTKLQVSSDTTDYDTGQISAIGSNANQKLSIGYKTSADIGFIQALKTGSEYKPLALNPNGGHVQIKTDPNAVWVYPNLTALQIRGSSIYSYPGYGGWSSNIYYNGAWKYYETYGGGYAEFDSNGGFSIYTVPSGTAGTTATLSQRLSLSSAGGLALTGNGNLDINPASGSANISLRTANTYQGYIEAISGGGILFGTGASATERMRISSGGVVTKPYQIAWSAAASGAPGSINGANIQLSYYSDVYLNVGSAYNGTNSRFTAPVAGVYFIKGQAWLPPAATLGALSIRVNGVQKAVHRMSHTGGQGSYCTLVPTLIRYLSAGDYVELYTSVDGGSLHLSNSEAYSNFSGYLLG